MNAISCSGGGYIGYRIIITEKNVHVVSWDLGEARSQFSPVYRTVYSRYLITNHYPESSKEVKEMAVTVNGKNDSQATANCQMFNIKLYSYACY